MKVASRCPPSCGRWVQMVRCMLFRQETRIDVESLYRQKTREGWSETKTSSWYEKLKVIFEKKSPSHQLWRLWRSLHVALASFCNTHYLWHHFVYGLHIVARIWSGESQYGFGSVLAFKALCVLLVPRCSAEGGWIVFLKFPSDSIVPPPFFGGVVGMGGSTR